VKIYDLNHTAIRRIRSPGPEELGELFLKSREPIIVEGLEPDYEFIQSWSLDRLGRLDSMVPAQVPEKDGVNYFFKYFQLPMSEFVEQIHNGKDLYIGAREIMGEGGVRSDKDGLGELATEVRLPPWFEANRLRSANLWVGAGLNRTLLHYDPWTSIQILREGEKDFYIYDAKHSQAMYQFSAFNFKALYQGKVLHSKIRPLDVKKRYRKKFSQVEGWKGTLKANEAIFIPAGFWHYVESRGQNIGINFFVHNDDKEIHKQEPLRTYWIKDNITLLPINLFMRTKARAFQVLRKVFPKREQKLFKN
jgi:hypothetical protein